jgi:hypothetical protein
MAIGSRGATTRCRIGTADQAIRTFGQEPPPRSNQRPKSGGANAGGAIKKYERAIIPIDAKARQQDAHDHVADVKKEK